MTTNNDDKTPGRRDFFQGGLDNMVKSLAEAKVMVTDVVDEVRGAAEEVMGDMPVEFEGRVFYRNRRKRVVAKDHSALVEIRDKYRSDLVAKTALKVLGADSELETAFLSYIASLKAYEGTMPQFEAVGTARRTLEIAALRTKQAPTLEGARTAQKTFLQVADITQDKTFLRIGSYLEGIGYFRETFATELQTLATEALPLGAKIRRELLAACVGARPELRQVLGLDAPDILAARPSGEASKLDRACLRGLASRLMDTGIEPHANQAHRDAEEQVSSAIACFITDTPLAAGFEVTDTFILATRAAFALQTPTTDTGSPNAIAD